LGAKNPWEQLQSAYDGLQAEQPDSPTTESVGTVLGSSRLPSIQRVRQLIEEAKNPKLPGADDDAWAELQRVAEELRRELPNADVTDDVTAAVGATTTGPPTSERQSFLAKAEKLLSRIRCSQRRSGRR